MKRIDKVKAVLKEGGDKIALLSDADIEWLIGVAEEAYDLVCRYDCRLDIDGTSPSSPYYRHANRCGLAELFGKSYFI